MAQFDALSPYHPTSEGILAKLMKRPYHERSMENKNIAAIFAGRLLIQTVLMVSYPIMPCPFTGPKMFFAGPNFLCQTKNVFTLSMSIEGVVVTA